MAEGTYEYECMRAELLGIDKPDYEEFMRNKAETVAQVAEEEIDTENLKEADQQNEGYKHITGGLEELNSILQSTQRKINKFKASCGSLTNLLKIKMGHGSGDPPTTTPPPENDSAFVATAANPTTEPEGGSSNDVEYSQNGTPIRKGDLNKALDNHVDRLDAMIEKADNARFSMAHQSKQMKKFLN